MVSFATLLFNMFNREHKQIITIPIVYGSLFTITQFNRMIDSLIILIKKQYFCYVFYLFVQ